jgi:hypothetical protein
VVFLDRWTGMQGTQLTDSLLSLASFMQQKPNSPAAGRAPYARPLPLSLAAWGKTHFVT